MAFHRVHMLNRLLMRAVKSTNCFKKLHESNSRCTLKNLRQKSQKRTGDDDDDDDDSSGESTQQHF